MTQFQSADFSKKSFWKRPEGVTGALVLGGLLLGGGYLLYQILPTLILLASNVLYLALMLAALGAILYMVLDPKMRNLVWYMYQSVMRSVTGVFINLDPIGILKSYVTDLENNLRKMSTQIGVLRGQMRKLEGVMQQNSKDIDLNMKIASKAQEKEDQRNTVLSSRKAARLQDSNSKYQELFTKMEILYRILSKMYSNSEILLEDTKDQVALKEQERKAIRASHSAMKSAMSVISGDPDKRAMFDRAVEAIADDVANKVGEMERFMEMSTSFMDSVDLQNGVFEEEGMKMLEQWEKQSTLMLMNDGKAAETNTLDLNAAEKVKNLNSPEENKGDNKYDNLFNS